MSNEITLISIMVILLLFLLVFIVNSSEGIQVKKCTFWVFMCHMEEHYIENCEVGEWLRKDYVTYYSSIGNPPVLIPYDIEYDIYQLTCTRVYDNGTENTWKSEKRM